MKKQNYKRWSKEEEKILKKLGKEYVKCNISFDDILKVFQNRTFWSVYLRLNSLGFVQREGTVINYDYLKELKKRGIRI